MKTEQLYLDAFLLLEKLIRIPSYSKEENKTADLLAEFMMLHGMDVHRCGNNVWSVNKKYDSAKPTLLLNSHHDTVKPTGAWTTNPFAPVLNGEKLHGLGVNDAGASLVSLLMTFRYFYHAGLPFNIVFAGTAEEEISGEGGIESISTQLGKIDFAIVGEPTGMEIAVAERGLLVLDCAAHGIPGHAARNEGVNAIVKALKDVEWFSDYHFERVSEWLGEMQMNVTIISAGTQHNVIPATCNFTVDIRLNGMYTTEEVLTIIRENVSCEIKPRSLRGSAKTIALDHPLVAAGRMLNRKLFGSPTSSDQALIPAPSIKMGPGESSRSHTADEFIYLHELRQGVEGYVKFIETLSTLFTSATNQHETLAERKNIG